MVVVGPAAGSNRQLVAVLEVTGDMAAYDEAVVAEPSLSDGAAAAAAAAAAAYTEGHHSLDS